MSLPDVIIILATAIICTAVGLHFFSRSAGDDTNGFDENVDSEISLLFKGDSLQHATTAAMRLADFDDGADDWATLRDSLLARFPTFPKQPTDDENAIIIQTDSEGDIAKLEIRKIGGCTHIQIIDDEILPLDVQHRIKSLEAEALVTGFAGSTAPHPIWQIDSKGKVCWYNAAYKTLYRMVFDDDPREDRPLFEVISKSAYPLNSTRSSLKSISDEKPMWFDISLVKVTVGTMCHAIDINAVIDAEIAQRNFVQTLAKTFAQLSIGLAIFDRNSQLALFNPALVNLSTLPAEFLAARPDLLSFFDRLRDKRVMPEPKNYHSWRQEIADVIAAATNGRYQETWSLDTGQTYRVSGRPHPDGAIAFLIEDISAEVSLARNFRSELEVGQSMMDTFDASIVVFSSSGVLQFCNASYRDMWKLDPDISFVDVTILDSVKDWQRQTKPNPSWADIRDFVLKIGERAQWDCEIAWKDGQALDCVIKPIAFGATMLEFQRNSTKDGYLPKKKLVLQN